MTISTSQTSTENTKDARKEWGGRKRCQRESRGRELLVEDERQREKEKVDYRRR